MCNPLFLVQFLEGHLNNSYASSYFYILWLNIVHKNTYPATTVFYLHFKKLKNVHLNFCWPFPKDTQFLTNLFLQFLEDFSLIHIEFISLMLSNLQNLTNLWGFLTVLLGPQSSVKKWVKSRWGEEGAFVEPCIVPWIVKCFYYFQNILLCHG